MGRTLGPLSFASEDATIPAVRGKQGRVLLALGLALCVAALVASLGRSTVAQSTAVSARLARRAGLGPRRTVGASPSKMTGSARPYRIPALRTLEPAPFKYQPRPEQEFESYPPRSPGSSTVDPAVQRSARNDLMPEPDPELRRHQQPVRLLSARHERRRRPEPLHGVGQPPLRDLQQDGSLQVVAPTPGNTLFTGMPFCGPHNNGDPIVLYDQFAGRWMASQFAFNSTSQGPFYQCIAVSDTDDPTGSLVRLRVPGPPDEVQRLPEVRDLAGAEHVHDDGAAVQLGTAARASGASSATRCSPARRRASSTRTWSPSMPTLPRHPAGGRRRRDRAAERRAQPIVTDNDDGAGFPADRIDVWNATMTWGTTPSISVVREGFTPDRAVRPEHRLCGAPVHSAARHDRQGRCPTEPSHVPGCVPELRHPPGARVRPHGRR